MSTRSLLKVATERYQLKDIKFYETGWARKGGQPHKEHDGSPAETVLVVVMPGQLGLFSFDVLKGKSPAGGLESLERDSKTKLACVLSGDDLSAGDVASHKPNSVIPFLGIFFPGYYASGQSRSSIVMHHKSGIDFTLSATDATFADRVMTGVTGFFEV